MKKRWEKVIQLVRNIKKNLGPGLITGASDDDPSGIATYSQAGAMYGFHLLWTALLSYPMMVAIQEMCARIGIVTRQGLTGTILRYYPKWLLYLILGISFPSITLNIGADIAGMGAVGNLLFPSIPAFAFSIFFTLVLLYVIIKWPYHKIATILKWLCITLFSYILIPFLIKTDWPAVFSGTIWPRLHYDKSYFLVLVGIFGTTISPYLFFWQTSMEVEERQEYQLIVDKKIMEGKTVREKSESVFIKGMKLDVRTGMFFTTLVFYFIILTTGSVLYSQGIHTISSVDEAAKALQPLAGDMTYVLFAIGVLGTGFLAIPVLGGSLSYMMAETFGWEEGLNKKFSEAPGFYLTMIISLFIGLLIHYTGISPVQALLYTAVLYGITAPVLIALILHICNQERIMGKFTNDRRTNILGLITLVVMTVSAGILIYYLLV